MGIDLAKLCFQIHGVCEAGKTAGRRQELRERPPGWAWSPDSTPAGANRTCWASASEGTATSNAADSRRAHRHPPRQQTRGQCQLDQPDGGAAQQERGGCGAGQQKCLHRVGAAGP